MNVLTISNGTMIRAAVIAHRTGSDFVAGYKSAMIERLKEKLRTGIASFVFLKKDGSVRVVETATTNPVLVDKWTNGYGESRERYGCCAFLELTAAGIQWRSFRWENLIQVF